MIRQRRQEIDELNGLEKAMEDYSEMKNVLYDLGKASSFKAEQKLLVSWYAPLSKRIAEEQKRCQQQSNHELSRRLLMLNPEKLAILTIHKVLNLCVPSATGSAPSWTYLRDRRSCEYGTSHRSSSKAQGSLGSASEKYTFGARDGKSALRRANRLASRVGWWSVTTGGTNSW